MPWSDFRFLHGLRWRLQLRPKVYGCPAVGFPYKGIVDTRCASPLSIVRNIQDFPQHGRREAARRQAEFQSKHIALEGMREIADGNPQGSARRVDAFGNEGVADRPELRADRGFEPGNAPCRARLARAPQRSGRMHVERLHTSGQRHVDGGDVEDAPRAVEVRDIPRLERCPAVLADALRVHGFVVANADLTILAGAPRIGRYRDEMRRTVAQLLAVDDSQVNIKATTTEGLGFIGRSEGLAAQAVVLLLRSEPETSR